MDEQWFASLYENGVNEGWNTKSEAEPYVNLFVVRNSGTPLRFFGVRGIYMTEAQTGHAPTLTFEDNEDKIYHVPNVSHWFTEYAD